MVVSAVREEPDLQRSGVVYNIHCACCPKVYIGQTGRRLSQWLTEHKGGVKMHWLSMPGLLVTLSTGRTPTYLVLRFGQHLPEGQKRLEADSNLQGSQDMSQAFRYSLNIWDDSHSSPFRCRCRSNRRRSSRGVNKSFRVAIQF